MIIRKRISALFNEVRLLVRFGFRKIGFPGYQIHIIELQDEPLIYIPIPKNACSTIKHALYEIEYSKEFDYDRADEWGYKDIHDYYKKRNQAFAGKRALEEEDKTIFAVIRDPVKRLISCYRNRVVDLEDLEKSKDALKRRKLPLKPDINTFILNLGKYQQANKIIEHHSRLQSSFLDDSLTYLDKIFPIEEFDTVKELLKQYKPDLQIKSEKSGGPLFDLADLSDKALEEAIHFYREDYNLLSSYYTPEDIREAYKNATA